MTDATPGSVQGMQLVVSDIRAAHAELLERGVEVGEVQEFPWGAFVFFSDPDGNKWSVQEIPRTRLAASHGRIARRDRTTLAIRDRCCSC